VSILVFKKLKKTWNKIEKLLFLLPQTLIFPSKKMLTFKMDLMGKKVLVRG
jgi:hypothetical protein